MTGPTREDLHTLDRLAPRPWRLHTQTGLLPAVHVLDRDGNTLLTWPLPAIVLARALVDVVNAT